MNNIEMYVLLDSLHKKVKEIHGMFDWDYINGDGKRFSENYSRMQKDGWAETYRRAQELRKRGVRVSVNNLYD